MSNDRLRQIRLIIKRFYDIQSDLLYSRDHNFENHLRVFVDFCESNPIIKKITSPLKNDQSIDIQKWWDDIFKEGHSMVGDKRYVLPTDINQQASLLYQFIIGIHSDRFDFRKFCWSVYGYSSLDMNVIDFNNDITQKLTRIIKNKLEELEKKIITKESKKLELHLEPATPFSSTQKVRKILSNTQGYVKVLDPWVDDYTLDVLLSVPKNIPIMLLTENTGGIKKAKSFLRSCRSFKVERPQFEIRKCEKGLLHDRYIISRDKAYSIGSSLKNLGKRLSSIIEMETKTNIEVQFEKIWKTSNKLI